MIKVPYNELDLVYVSNYYDIPLSGLCRYNGELARFDIDESEEFYNITRLSIWGKVKALFDKWAFEFCVGKHWSYSNGKRLGTYSPNAFGDFTRLAKFYYWIRRK